MLRSNITFTLLTSKLVCHQILLILPQYVPRNHPHATILVESTIISYMDYCSRLSLISPNFHNSILSSRRNQQQKKNPQPLSSAELQKRKHFKFAPFNLLNQMKRANGESQSIERTGRSGCQESELLSVQEPPVTRDFQEHD